FRSDGLKRALFLDRDGTIIADRGYMRDPSQVELLPGAVDALRSLAAEGWVLVVISNQSGVGRGLIGVAEMDAVQDRFLAAMHDARVPIAGSYLCTHHPDENCACRKPSTLFLQEAARAFELDLAQSWMIGDRESDVLCGKNAGCRTMWLENAEFPVVPGLADFVARDWAAARAIISL